MKPNISMKDPDDHSTNISHIDLNCDMGEGIGNDELVFPFISSANIACGYHAGDGPTMLKTIEWATRYNVAIGAHVSFPDKENFGRVEMDLPTSRLHELVIEQLAIIKNIAERCSARLSHVKPHGALYNMSARDAGIAKTIASAVKEFDATLVLFGLSNSHSIREARSMGLRTANEVFADRTYSDDGSLTPRSAAGALIEDPDQCIQQVLQMIKEKKVTTTTGKQIAIDADTICIHGDGIHAVDFARNIFTNLKQNNIAIKAI